jgi:hypothetical protein
MKFSKPLSTAPVSPIPPMTVLEYTHTPSDTTTRCIGTLITIAYLSRLFMQAEDTAFPVKVRVNE